MLCVARRRVDGSFGGGVLKLGGRKCRPVWKTCFLETNCIPYLSCNGVVVRLDYSCFLGDERMVCLFSDHFEQEFENTIVSVLEVIRSSLQSYLFEI